MTYNPTLTYAAAMDLLLHAEKLDRETRLEIAEAVEREKARLADLY